MCQEIEGKYDSGTHKDRRSKALSVWGMPVSAWGKAPIISNIVFVA